MTDSVALRPIKGACHCRNISYTLLFPASETPIPVRACSCSFCRKHGGVYTSHPHAKLDVRIADTGQLERYRFGSGTAEFLICRRCGAVPVVTSLIGDNCYGVVNVNTLENIDRAEFAEAATDFEGEATGDRLARRQRNWIPDVVIVEEDAKCVT